MNKQIIPVLLVSGFLFSQIVRSQSATRFTYIASWGEKGTGPVQFRNPQGIDVDPSGFLYVADTGNQRIQKIDQRGRFVSEIGGFGWQAEQFDNPVSCWAGNGLDVFVADYNNDRIQRFDKDLHYIASLQVTDFWPETLHFGLPLDMALSPQGELFCLDGENQRLLKLDILGNPQRSFGDFDAGAGRLSGPRRLLVTNEGHVIVSDDSRTLFIYDIHGNFLIKRQNPLLKLPRGLAELPDQCIAVADAENGLLIFRWDGRQIGRLQGSDSGGFEYRQLVDVAVYRDILYVLDEGRQTVDIFRWQFESGDF